MIYLARSLNDLDERKDLNDKFSEAVEKERQGYAKLNDALFRLYGPYGLSGYPDATFTLRLAFGMIRPVYQETSKLIFSWTTIGDIYKHAADFDNQGDHQLPRRWYSRKRSVNLRIPLNFISDLDITGGNSGSPVFNRNLEIMGVVFDSNMEGLVSDYDYNYSPQARAIAVHSAGITEILDKIYKADRLVEELTGR